MVAPQQDRIVSTPAPVVAGAGFADPGPLGLAGFAMTTFFLSTVNTNMVGGTVTDVVLGLALFYGGLAQLLAGMWEFVKGNTFGAVAFTSFGAFWMSFWYLLNHVPKAPGVDLDHGLGLYLLGWAIFTAYMTIAATRVSGVVLAVFAFLTLTFVALAVGKFAGNPTAMVPNGWTKLGGWLGLVTAALAWYGSLAGVMNATAKRIVFPTFPR
ncbi:MAG: acetate uptake transporter [Actinomycetota bacterium]|nr:acetate uptake transporter [Actinomycetota bacterium]